jgi:hypothetical protein
MVERFLEVYTICCSNGLARTKDHLKDRYFCLTKISGISLKSKHSIQYLSLPSAVRPVLHSQDLPFPKPPEKWTIDDDSSDDEPIPMEQDITDPDFQPSTSNEPHLISQGELNDLVRDLNLSKSRAELLGSRLQGWNLLQKNTNISVFCYRQKILLSILLQLVIWFTGQILINSWLH